MQDKNKQFMDKGWQDMSALLDAEMPVAGKRKRRAIFWMWMAAATLGLVLAGSTYFLLNPSQIVVAEFSSPAVEKGALESPIPTHEGPSETLLPAIAALPSSVEAKVVLAMPTDTPLETDTPATMPELPLYEFANPEILPVAPGFTAKSKTVVPLERIMLDELAMPASAIQLPEAYHPKTRFLQIGWEGALGINPIISGFHAANTGPVAALRLSPKWKFRAGLQIASERYPITSNESNSEIRTAGIPEATSFQDDSSALGVVVRSVGYGHLWTFHAGGIQAPLILERRLHARWSAETGITPVYWWDISNATGMVFDSGGPVLGTQVNFSMANLDQSVASTIHRFDCRISAGLRYHVNPNWSIGAQFQASLRDLQPAPPIESKQKLWRMSAIYYF